MFKDAVQETERDLHQSSCEIHATSRQDVAGLCVQKEVRWCSQVTLKSFLFLNRHKEVENFCIVCSI